MPLETLDLQTGLEELKADEEEVAPKVPLIPTARAAIMKVVGRK